MTTEPGAREREPRYNALLARASRERGNEACVECEDCHALNAPHDRESYSARTEPLARGLKK